MIPSRAVVCASALLLLGCDSSKGAVGSWFVGAIDGVGVGSATALRVPVPAGSYDTLTLTDGWMWKEYMLDSLVLELRPDGTFGERRAEASSAGVTRSSFDRPDYAPLFGGELIRDDAKPSTHEIDGTWAVAGDTLRLVVTREATIDDVIANLGDILTAPPDQFRANVDAALPRELPPRWVGVRKGDRLELRDPEGRAFVFRRPGATP